MTEKHTFDELVELIRETDLTSHNPAIQQIIEDGLSEWVDSYERKKTRNFSDTYGKLGQIPDKIQSGKQFYSPNEILEHVKARDKMGLSIIDKIDDYRREFPLTLDNGRLIRQFKLMSEENDLDKAVINGMCGEHNQTIRDLMEDIINPSSESVFLTTGLSNAIKQWYGAPIELQRDSIYTRNAFQQFKADLREGYNISRIELDHVKKTGKTYVKDHLEEFGGKEEIYTPVKQLGGALYWLAHPIKASVAIHPIKAFKEKYLNGPNNHND